MNLEIIKLFSHSEVLSLCFYSCTCCLFLIITGSLEVLYLEHMKSNKNAYNREKNILKSPSNTTCILYTKNKVTLWMCAQKAWLMVIKNMKKIKVFLIYQTQKRHGIFLIHWNTVPSYDKSGFGKKSISFWNLLWHTWESAFRVCAWQLWLPCPFLYCILKVTRKDVCILVLVLIVFELWVTQRLSGKGSVVFNKCTLLVYKKI